MVVPAFAGGRLDRAAHRREGLDVAASLSAGARIIQFWNGQIALTKGGGLHLLSDPAGTSPRADDPMIFLGTAEGPGEVFARDLGRGDPVPPLPEAAEWADLRQALLRLDPTEAELAATGRALVHWHQSHGFCAACGTASILSHAGWQRQCPQCKAAHFPRTDPVVIMLVTRGESLLVGRSPGWPEGMYSTLAGFMEPGETVEAAVRREVAEETGVVVGAVRYLSSQPWPFPASLMLGCHGQATSDTITLDPAELDDALWVTRAEWVLVLTGNHPRLRPPRQGSIAQALIVNWLADRQI